MELVRSQTGAVAALLFYGHEGGLAGCGSGDDAASYPQEALQYLQQRLLQLRLPLAFNLTNSQVRNLTRAEARQPRDYVAWLVPAADSWTELLVLRGAWPANAISGLLEFVDSAMPAITIILERFVRVGRKERLEQQIATITNSVATISRSSEVIGSVAAAFQAKQGLPKLQVALLKELAAEAAATCAEVRANRDLMEAHLRLQEYTSRLQQAMHVERRHATTDSLTELINHRGALETVESEVKAARAEARPLSLLLGDIDGFKLFNDVYGHVQGDEVLKLVARECQRAVGSEGNVCRYGGDEFLIILPNKDKEAATRLANRIAQGLGRAEFHAESNTVVPIRMSLGVASFPEDTESPSKLIALADAAMYAAKRRLEGNERRIVTTRDDTTFGVLDSLVLAVDAKDRYTKDHCDLVAEYAVKLADRLNLSEDAKRALRIAGLLHDIGKLAIPDEILKKPAPLNQDEYEAMQHHVRIGEVLIREVPQLKDVIQAVSCHHERYDGTGYPRGLKEDDIPLLGRIIAIADAYSAMCLDRPYRKALSHDRILGEFVAGSGIQFDPKLADAFVELLLQEQLQKKEVAA
jgi:diguanylate cyclase (GGDEF)-like protein/putative nucleotidyltransferase with HDIG domain